MAAKDRFFTQIAADICGFSDNLNAGKCPICGVKADETKLRDDISRKEFAITGICQPCQDMIFSEEK